MWHVQSHSFPLRLTGTVQLITHPMVYSLIISWSNWPVVTLLIVTGLGSCFLHILMLYIFLYCLSYSRHIYLHVRFGKLPFENPAVTAKTPKNTSEFLLVPDIHWGLWKGCSIDNCEHHDPLVHVCDSFKSISSRTWSHLSSSNKELRKY